MKIARKSFMPRVNAPRKNLRKNILCLVLIPLMKIYVKILYACINAPVKNCTKNLLYSYERAYKKFSSLMKIARKIFYACYKTAHKKFYSHSRNFARKSFILV